MEVNETGVFSLMCPLSFLFQVTRVALFIQEEETGEMYRTRQFLSSLEFSMPGILFPFPLIAGVELHDISVTLDLLQKRFLAQAFAFIFFFFPSAVLPGNDSDRPTSDITDGMCLNVKNPCVYDRFH